ncbi:hypothetical protein HPB50_026558 [Hyalomma asiaticum]|uniref:Uncharacterized protein n=1 Tax=Hyalomma asiaticum TaxID=266040 RepID=A0ACB7TR43_HYAAI|nr:hypothetical protein HPB50_026558 [Hyalomma asiaticum]
MKARLAARFRTCPRTVSSCRRGGIARKRLDNGEESTHASGPNSRPRAAAPTMQSRGQGRSLWAPVSSLRLQEPAESERRPGRRASSRPIAIWVIEAFLSCLAALAPASTHSHVRASGPHPPPPFPPLPFVSSSLFFGPESSGRAGAARRHVNWPRCRSGRVRHPDRRSRAFPPNFLSSPCHDAPRR